MMDNKYLGELGTDVYGLALNEMRLAHITYTAAQTVAADADALLNDFTLGAAGLEAKTFLAQPPYARNITIVCSAAQTGKAVVHGFNIAGEPITEDFTLTSDTPVVGAKAFKTVTKIVWPIKAGSETADVGFGQLIGLPLKLSAAPLCWALNDGVLDTAPAITANANDLAKNVVDFNGSLDGSVMDLYMAL